MTAKYDLTLNKGANFNLFLQYLGTADNAITLAGYSASMQIRRYKDADYPLVVLTGRGVTSGYTAGYTSGYAGIGGISLDKNTDGTALTGGIYIQMDWLTTSRLPAGRHLYDLELSIGTTFVNKILQGRVDIYGDLNRET
jgi:hypothetical protein